MTGITPDASNGGTANVRDNRIERLLDFMHIHQLLAAAACPTRVISTMRPWAGQ